MSVTYETIIGLEVHAQMNTKTKMFCGCDNDAFGKAPNVTVCPICMGHPGTLPAPNKSAMEKAKRAALAIGCTLAEDHHFDRKNYFYPDLPMGYQISQYDYPLSKNGMVEYDILDESGRMVETKKCRIVRLHLENDAGKLVHQGGRSYCDYNRAGTPLMEIVTEPDLRSPSEAVAFAQELRRILISVDASEADMFKGMMRFDASISLRPLGEEKLYPRAEIKNLNSFRSLEKALHFEEKRIRKLWEAGTPPTSEVTVHWDDEKGEGAILRDKESAADYRYFPEPDIPPFHAAADETEKLRSEITVLPRAKRLQYVSQGLSEAEALTILDDPLLAAFFDAVVEKIGDPKRARSVVLTQLIGFLNAAGKTLAEGPSIENVLALLAAIDQGKISANTAKSVLETMVKTGKSPLEIIAAEGLQQISNTDAVRTIVENAIAANPQAVADYRSGKERALAAIVGHVMKETRGQADPGIVNALVRELVGK